MLCTDTDGSVRCTRAICSRTELPEHHFWAEATQYSFYLRSLHITTWCFHKQSGKLLLSSVTSLADETLTYTTCSYLVLTCLVKAWGDGWPEAFSQCYTTSIQIFLLERSWEKHSRSSDQNIQKARIIIIFPERALVRISSGWHEAEWTERVHTGILWKLGRQSMWHKRDCCLFWKT